MKVDKSTWSIVAVMAIAAIVGCIGDRPTESIAEGVEVVQCWIGALIGGLSSIAGGVTSAIVANQQAKKAQAQQDLAQAQLQDWHDSIQNTNILDRADTQAMLNAYRDAQEEQMRKYQTNAIKGGASEEAKVAYAQAANKGYADAISKIAASGQQRKDMAADAYMQGMQNIYNQKANAYLESGKAMGSAISGAFNSIGSALGGVDWQSYLPKKEGGNTNGK